MRWIWIDRFTEFTPGVSAAAIKNVSLAEEHLRDHFPGYAVMPPSLIIEGMAQTAGILVGQAREFQENVILAKIRKAEFHDYAVPGDQLRYQARIETIDDTGAATAGEVFLNNRPMGRVDLMFSHVSRSNASVPLPDHNFVFTDEFMSLFDAFQQSLTQESAP